MFSFSQESFPHEICNVNTWTNLSTYFLKIYQNNEHFSCFKNVQERLGKNTYCGKQGMFVVLQYEGRWSIELINDRNTPVKSFSWSHDGRMALICYQVSHVQLCFKICLVYFHLSFKVCQKQLKIPYKLNLITKQCKIENTENLHLICEKGF